jgi:hypothetical protein
MLQAADRENERKRIVEEKEKKKRFEKKQKQKNTNQDFVSLKEGDAQEIVLKIRSKRVAEKRKKLMDQRFEERNSLTRRNSNSSL